MKLIVLIFGCFAASKALVCTPELCGMIKAAPLQCKGSIIKGGGFCGCTDACAKVCSAFWSWSFEELDTYYFRFLKLSTNVNTEKTCDLINANDIPARQELGIVIQVIDKDRIDIPDYSLYTGVH